MLKIFCGLKRMLQKLNRKVHRQSRSNDPFQAIIHTVQVIPENIGKMFEQAERFTRTTVLPLVSSITPRFLTDFFAPKPSSRYIPFTSEESTDSSFVKLDMDEVARNRKNKRFNPPPISQRHRRSRKNNQSYTTESTTVDEDLSKIHSGENTTEATTPYSNIQKIPRKKHLKKSNINR